MTLRTLNIHPPGRKIKAKTKYFLLAIPFFVFVIMMFYVPLFGWAYSFVKYQPGVPFLQMPWVGLDHFYKLIQYWPQLSLVLRNTIALSLLTLLFTPLPIFVAIMLNEVRSNVYRRFVQTVTTLPNFISWVVVFGLATIIFSSNGMFNSLLGNLGLPRYPHGLIGSYDAAWFFQTVNCKS